MYKLTSRIIRKLKSIFSKSIDRLVLPRDLQLPSSSRIRSTRFDNPRHISIGKDCYIGPHSHLSVATFTTTEEFSATSQEQHTQTNEFGRIVINDGFYATSRLEIFCRSKVTIERDVLVASNVLIIDHSHGVNPEMGPYKSQRSISCSNVLIGEGSWLGHNVCILAGVSVGKYSIIGANSVVVGDTPDFSVSVGSPARTIKIYNFQLHQWVSVDPLAAEHLKTER